MLRRIGLMTNRGRKSSDTIPVIILFDPQFFYFAVVCQFWYFVDFFFTFSWISKALNYSKWRKTPHCKVQRHHFQFLQTKSWKGFKNSTKIQTPFTWNKNISKPKKDFILFFTLPKRAFFYFYLNYFKLHKIIVFSLDAGKLLTETSIQS